MVEIAGGVRKGRRNRERGVHLGVVLDTFLDNGGDGEVALGEHGGSGWWRCYGVGGDFEVVVVVRLYWNRLR